MRPCDKPAHADIPRRVRNSNGRQWSYCVPCQREKAQAWYQRTNRHRPRKEDRDVINLTVDSWTWRDAALCDGMDIDLFSLSRPAKDLAAIKKVCAECPVAKQCLQDAVDLESWGYMRGGENPERHSPKQQRVRELERDRCKRARLRKKTRSTGG